MDFEDKRKTKPGDKGEDYVEIKQINYFLVKCKYNNNDDNATDFRTRCCGCCSGCGEPA